VENGRAGQEPRAAERRLPQNLDAERCVLGAILLDSTAALSAFQILIPRDFYSTRHEKIFESAQALFDQLQNVDPVLVQESLARRGIAEEVGGLDYLEELVRTVPTVANAEFHARIVKEKAILRNLIATCTEVVSSAYESGEDARAQLDRAEQRVFEIGQSGITRDFVQIHEIIDDHFRRIDQCRTEGLMSGFVDLDNLTTGLHPAEYVIVAGRPSMGKTSFAMNVVQTVASQGKAVAIFSLEVSRDQLVQNLLCSFSKVDALRVRKHGGLSHGEVLKLTEGAEKLSQFKVFVDDTPSLSPLALKAKARRLHARNPLDLVVVDYLQLMETPGSESRQQEVSVISRSLKALARELNVPVIAISQLSRGVENREQHKPRLSDLRESGAIEQDADLVLLLYRQEYYEPEKEEAKGRAEVIIAKQRNGPTGSVELAFLSQFMKFENLARREDVF
jgi:replicative DNA helicase